jgi:hypothetical protein
MPGLDFAVEALARAGLISLSVGQTAPTTNQQSTAWFRPSVPSWVAEGTLFLWNAATVEYELATPALWTALLSSSSGSSASFQSVISGSATVLAGTSILAIQRVGPTATALLLPSLAAQIATGRKLQVVDFSTSVVGHVLTLTTPDGATIMRQNSWQLLSTAAQLAGVMLTPSPDLNSWIIAP